MIVMASLGHIYVLGLLSWPVPPALQHLGTQLPAAGGLGMVVGNHSERCALRLLSPECV